MFVIKLLFLLLTNCCWSWNDTLLRYTLKNNPYTAEQNLFLSAHEDKIRYVATDCLRHHKNMYPVSVVGEMSFSLSGIPDADMDKTIVLLGNFLCYSFLLTDPGFLLSEQDNQGLEKKMSYWLLELDDYFISERQKYVGEALNPEPEFLRGVAGETERQAEAIRNYLLSDLKSEGNLKEIFKSRFSQAQRLYVGLWSKLFSAQRRSTKDRSWRIEFLYYLIMFSGLFCFAIYTNSK